MGKKRSVLVDTNFHVVRKNRFQVFESDSEEDGTTPVDASQGEGEQKGVGSVPLDADSSVGAAQTGWDSALVSQSPSVEDLRNRWACGQTPAEFPNFFSRGLRHVPVASPVTWDVPMFLDEDRFSAMEGSPSVFPVLKQGTLPQGRFSVPAEVCLIADPEEEEEGEKKGEKTFAMRIKESLDAVEKEKHAQNLEKNHANRVEAIRSSLTQLSFFRKGLI